jgi:hypothetical protein
MPALRRRTLRRRVLPAVVMLAVAVTSGLLVLPAGAAPVFTVDDTTDAPDAAPGDGRCASTHEQRCTLRAAVMEAGASGGARIVLPAGTFQLAIPGGTEVDPAATGLNAPTAAAGDLDISNAIDIVGADPAKTVIDGMNSVRVFDVHPGGVLNLEQLRIKNGRADYDSASTHVHGGAIHNHGYLNLFHVVIDNNASAPNWGGGGITNGGDGVAGLTEVTVARNVSPSHGAGIENVGRLTLRNVTITENQAPTQAGAGLWSSNTTTMSSSILAGNTGGDCLLPITFNPITSGGHNLQGDGSCTGLNLATDYKGDPAFQAGLPGAPLYYPLSSYSPAEDSAGENNCSGTDIRGVTRPQDSDNDTIAECDMGSYEKEPGLIDNVAKLQGITDDRMAALSVTGQTVREPTPDASAHAATIARAPRPALMVFTVRLSKRVSKPVRVRAATLNGTARAGSDYRGRRATLRFRPRQTVKRFVVLVLGDRRNEPRETLKVRLSDPVGATLLRTMATGRII